jgi:hypothetical protein
MTGEEGEHVALDCRMTCVKTYRVLSQLVETNGSIQELVLDVCDAGVDSLRHELRDGERDHKPRIGSTVMTTDGHRRTPAGSYGQLT